MSKYSLDTKFQIIADHETGKGGYRAISKKYIISWSIIKDWIHNYQDLGIEGLQVKVSKTHYTIETKLSAIECYLNTELRHRSCLNIRKIKTKIKFVVSRINQHVNENYS